MHISKSNQEDMGVVDTICSTAGNKGQVFQAPSNITNHIKLGQQKKQAEFVMASCLKRRICKHRIKQMKSRYKIPLYNGAGLTLQ